VILPLLLLFPGVNKNFKGFSGRIELVDINLFYLSKLSLSYLSENYFS